MADITDPFDIPESEPIGEARLQSIINKIDQLIYNLVNGGKWDLLPHAEFGNVGKKDDPDKQIEALRKLRGEYKAQLDALPFEEITQFDPTLEV